MGLFCDECLTPTFILTMAQLLGAREALGNRNHLCTGDKFLTWPKVMSNFTVDQNSENYRAGVQEDLNWVKLRFTFNKNNPKKQQNNSPPYFLSHLLWRSCSEKKRNGLIMLLPLKGLCQRHFKHLHSQVMATQNSCQLFNPSDRHKTR